MNRQLLVRPALALGALLLVGGASPAAAGDDIVLYARNASTRAGAWSVVTDSSAAGGARMANPDADAAKRSSASSSPSSYFDIPFTAKTGVGYHLWIRGKAQNDDWTNDSAFVQFSGSITASGSAVYRIGTTSATVYSLEASSGAGESGWGWEDNEYGGLAAPIYFSGTSQTIRVQVREDGLSIDQIVLSPVTYATKAPGANKNDTTILSEGGGSSTTTTTTTTSSSATSPGGAVSWINAVNATASGASLKKTSGCSGCYDAGAISQQALTSGTVSFSAATGKSMFVGLSADTSKSAGYANIKYAFKFSGSAWEIRESNVYRKDGSFTSSDVFSIGVNAGKVTYYRNGSALYTSTIAASGALVMDTSMSTVGATVTNAAMSGSTSPTGTSDGGGTSGGTTDGGSTSTTTKLRVLQWNTHHGGYGTDGVYSPSRLATWAASFKPDIVMFNEIEKNDSWGNQDQPEVYKSLLQQKTGKTWYYVFAQEFGEWSSNGKGNLILSTFPLQIVDRHELLHNADRSIAMAQVTVANRDITLILTHLDPDDASLRLTQAKEVTAWAAIQPENRIITGDMNAWPDQTSIAQLDSLYNDSWAVAKANGTATAFSGNNGETKSGRIDYIFYSKSSPNLKVVSSQVYDTRDSNGVTPSDHRPVLTVFEVK
jgi:endonuclease/exonuclease/phosphatase family metal-dependent hydrolase